MLSRTELFRYHGRLEGILKDLTLRLKIFTALEFVLQLVFVFLVLILGGLGAQATKEVFPYLPFVYYLFAWISFIVVLLLGLWKTVSRLPRQQVARALEDKFAPLRDDVTNALLLFDQIKTTPQSDLSEGLVTAHLRKTAAAVSEIPPNQVVNFGKALTQVKVLLPLLAVFAVIIALDTHFLSRSMAYILHPFSSLPMRNTFISLAPAPSIALRGTPFVIKASATGYIPDRLSLRLWPEGGVAALVDMEPQGKGEFNHLIASAQTSFGYQAFGNSAYSPVYQVRVVEAPAIGKIKLTLIPPSYTRLPREVSEDGYIEAIKGTIVEVEALATKAVKEGMLILDRNRESPLKVEGNRLQGNLLVYYPGTYSLSIRDELGFENLNPAQYRIQVVPDKYPEGEIVSPQENLDVSGNETFPITYTARDDFGVRAVNLSYQMGETQKSIILKELNNSRSTGPERFDWDLASLTLTPGDRVAYRLEVWDNDAVSGPKAGYSRTLILQVRDEKNLAAREVEQAQEISHALFDLLADQLEDMKDNKALAQELNRIMEMTDHYLEQKGPEKVERYDLESLKRNLDTLNRRIDEFPKEKTTQELERLSLLAEGLAERAKMHEVEALSNELTNRQRRLIDALQDLKGPLKPEALQEMLKELEKLKDLARQVMEALSRMASQLPDDFINSLDLQGLDFQDLFKDLDEIQKMLLAGNWKGALAAAQNMLQKLSQMMTAMARAGAQASRGSFNRLQAELAHQSGELDTILEEQQEILKGTESIDKDLRRLIEAETERRFNRMASRLQEILDQLHHQLPDEQEDLLSELAKLLKDRQVDRFSELAETMDKELVKGQDIQKLVDEFRNISRALTPDRRGVMTEGKREEFPGLSSRQETVQKKTKGLSDSLEMLSQLFPGMDMEIINDLKDAAGAMEGAAGKLKGEDAAGAIPPEEGAIRSLTRSQQSMQQMAQQMAMRMQANQWGYQLVYDPRAGWHYGPWQSLPTLPQPDVKRQPILGNTGIDKQEFKPPAKDAYKAPPILREKVMEALKEDIPSQYRREVQRYFRGLTE